MPDDSLAGIGSIISGVGGLLPHSTSSNSSGSGTLDANTASNTANISGSELSGSTNQQQTGGSTSNTTGITGSTGSTSETGATTGSNTSSTSGTQTGNTQTQQQQSSTGQTTVTNNQVVTSSQAAIDAITGNIKQAVGNSTDTSKTTDLISSILQQAAMVFAPTQAVQTGAGLFGSTSLNLLGDFAKAQATTQAAGAVLNYQTAQQQLAEGNAAALAEATKTTTGTTSTTSSAVANLLSTVLSGLASNSGTTGSTSGTTANTGASTGATTQSGSTTGTSFLSNITATLQSLLSGSQGAATGTQLQNTTQQATSQGSSGISVICTVLKEQGQLDPTYWRLSSLEFRYYSQLVKDSYYTWGIPAALWIRKHPGGKLARLLRYLMIARGQKKFIGVAPVAVVTFLAGCYMLAGRLLSANFYRNLYRTSPSSLLEPGEQE